MTVRRATAGDLDDVARIEEDNLGADAWSAGLLAQGIAGELPTMLYLVAETERGVVGYAAASIVQDVAELQRIAVDPDARRRGLATDLLGAVTEEARGAGADRLLLEVREDNGVALAFYAARGFVEIDRRPRYYRDGAAAVVMGLAMAEGSGP